MNEERKVCAEFSHKDETCHYAKIVEKTGEYPVITFQAKERSGIPDLSTMHNVKTRVDTKCWCVFCTHPNLLKEMLIGSIEPYSYCYAPNNCPELEKKSETSTSKVSLWEIVKNFFAK